MSQIHNSLLLVNQSLGEKVSLMVGNMFVCLFVYLHVVSILDTPFNLNISYFDTTLRKRLAKLVFNGRKIILIININKKNFIITRLLCLLINFKFLMYSPGSGYVLVYIFGILKELFDFFVFFFNF